MYTVQKLKKILKKSSNTSSAASLLFYNSKEGMATASILIENYQDKL